MKASSEIRVWHYASFPTPLTLQTPLLLSYCLHMIKRDPWVLGILGDRYFLAFIELSSNHTVLCTSLLLASDLQMLCLLYRQGN